MLDSILRTLVLPLALRHNANDTSERVRVASLCCGNANFVSGQRRNGVLSRFSVLSKIQIDYRALRNPLRLHTPKHPFSCALSRCWPVRAVETEPHKFDSIPHLSLSHGIAASTSQHHLNTVRHPPPTPLPRPHNRHTPLPSCSAALPHQLPIPPCTIQYIYGPFRTSGHQADSGPTR